MMNNIFKNTLLIIMMTLILTNCKNNIIVDPETIVFQKAENVWNENDFVGCLKLNIDTDGRISISPYFINNNDENRVYIDE